MKIYDRHKKLYIDTEQYGQGILQFLYDNPFGRFLLKLAVSPIVSKLYGYYNSLAVSKKKIPDFIKKYNINMDDFKPCEYSCFNDFFTRELKTNARPISTEPNILISPADSKILLYQIGDDLKISIKNSIYTLDELVGSQIDTSSFKNGICLVFRLCMDDYHRYCFVDNGILNKQFFIPGKLHTVSSLSKDYKIYKENSRNVSVCQTENFGEIFQIEVGALLVGGIKNKNVDSFTKGTEKGYFEPGGSTVVILIKDGVVQIDSDITAQSQKGIETIVKYGERIGRKIP